MKGYHMGANSVVRGTKPKRTSSVEDRVGQFKQHVVTRFDQVCQAQGLKRYSTFSHTQAGEKKKRHSAISKLNFDQPLEEPVVDTKGDELTGVLKDFAVTYY